MYLSPNRAPLCTAITRVDAPILHAQQAEEGLQDLHALPARPCQALLQAVFSLPTRADQEFLQGVRPVPSRPAQAQLQAVQGPAFRHSCEEALPPPAEQVSVQDMQPMPARRGEGVLQGVPALRARPVQALLQRVQAVPHSAAAHAAVPEVQAAPAPGRVLWARGSWPGEKRLHDLPLPSGVRGMAIHQTGPGEAGPSGTVCTSCIIQAELDAA